MNPDTRNTRRFGAPEPVTPVRWIRMLDKMYVKGNYAALRVEAGAILRVQQGRDDRDFDVPFDKALDLIAAEFAEEATGPDGAAQPGEPVDGNQLDALWDTVLGLRTALAQIAQLADDGTVPPSKRLPAIQDVIAQLASKTVSRPQSRPAAPAGRKGSWNGR